MFAKTAKKTGIVLPTTEQVCELLAIIAMQLARIIKLLDRETVQYWIGRPRELGVALKKVLIKKTAASEQLADWVCFYQEVFGLEADVSDIVLPPEKEGFGWVVLVLKGLTRNQVFEICVKRFKSWRCYNDLDEAVTQNDREPAEAYTIRVRDRVEADEENKDKSANTAAQSGIKGMTIMERMLLELWYHWKTGKHLDVVNVTICSGSRYAVGDVPNADWHVDEFSVGGVDPVAAYDFWRVREVVS